MVNLVNIITLFATVVYNFGINQFHIPVPPTNLPALDLPLFGTTSVDTDTKTIPSEFLDFPIEIIYDRVPVECAVDDFTCYATLTFNAFKTKSINKLQTFQDIITSSYKDSVDDATQRNIKNVYSAIKSNLQTFVSFATVHTSHITSGIMSALPEFNITQVEPNRTIPNHDFDCQTQEPPTPIDWRTTIFPIASFQRNYNPAVQSVPIKPTVLSCYFKASPQKRFQAATCEFFAYVFASGVFHASVSPIPFSREPSVQKSTTHSGRFKADRSYSVPTASYDCGKLTVQPREDRILSNSRHSVTNDGSQEKVGDQKMVNTGKFYAFNIFNSTVLNFFLGCWQRVHMLPARFRGSLGWLKRFLYFLIFEKDGRGLTPAATNVLLIMIFGYLLVVVLMCLWLMNQYKMHQYMNIPSVARTKNQNFGTTCDSVHTDNINENCTAHDSHNFSNRVNGTESNSVPAMYSSSVNDIECEDNSIQDELNNEWEVLCSYMNCMAQEMDREIASNYNSDKRFFFKTVVFLYLHLPSDPYFNGWRRYHEANAGKEVLTYSQVMCQVFNMLHPDGIKHFTNKQQKACIDLYTLLNNMYNHDRSIFQRQRSNIDNIILEFTPIYILRVLFQHLQQGTAQSEGENSLVVFTGSSSVTGIKCDNKSIQDDLNNEWKKLRSYMNYVAHRMDHEIASNTYSDKRFFWRTVVFLYLHLPSDPYFNVWRKYHEDNVGNELLTYSKVKRRILKMLHSDRIKHFNNSQQELCIELYKLLENMYNHDKKLIFKGYGFNIDQVILGFRSIDDLRRATGMIVQT